MRLTVLVYGGRAIDVQVALAWLNEHARQSIIKRLEAHCQIGCVIHGKATGADTAGMLWGQRLGVQVLGYGAEWNRHGAMAGPIRNQRMIDEGRPHIAIAFPGGAGTKDMTGRLRAAGIPIIEAEWRT